jgi:hypothetical protein
MPIAPQRSFRPRLIQRALMMAVSTSLLLTSMQVVAEPPKPDHPLIGSWQWTREENNCTEIYDFRADGTSSVISGEELTEHTYTISPGPVTNGFFKLVMTMTKTNNKQDCSDAPPSAEAYAEPSHTVYIVFHRNEPQYLMCRAPNLEQCFGPLHRIESPTRT